MRHIHHNVYGCLMPEIDSIALMSAVIVRVCDARVPIQKAYHLSIVSTLNYELKVHSGVPSNRPMNHGPCHGD